MGEWMKGAKVLVAFFDMELGVRDSFSMQKCSLWLTG